MISVAVEKKYHSSLQPIYTTIDGNKYQVFVGADGQYYLHDPAHTLSAQHVALPTTTRDAGQKGLHGLGQSAQAYGTVAATALSFVPVVGPILGPIAGAVASLFGGGDPTPASSLWSSVISLRQQVAQLTNQIAGSVVDTFTVPAGLDPNSDGPSGGNTGNVLSAKIVADVLGLSSGDIHSVKRAQYYQAIQSLQSAIQQLQQKAHDQQLTQSIVAQVQAQVPTAPNSAAPIAYPQSGVNPAYISSGVPINPVYNTVSTPPALPVSYPQDQLPTIGTTTTSVNDYLPYIAVGGMLLLAALM